MITADDLRLKATISQPSHLPDGEGGYTLSHTLLGTRSVAAVAQNGGITIIADRRFEERKSTIICRRDSLTKMVSVGHRIDIEDDIFTVVSARRGLPNDPHNRQFLTFSLELEEEG